MKKYIISLFIILSINAIGQSPNVIGRSIKIGILEIAQYDFPKKMNWYEATQACANLGENWRLPTRYELNYLYINKVVIGVFVLGNYWSSTQEEDGVNVDGVAYFHNFANDEKPKSVKNQRYYVRAVRSIN